MRVSYRREIVLSGADLVRMVHHALPPGLRPSEVRNVLLKAVARDGTRADVTLGEPCFVVECEERVEDAEVADHVGRYLR